MTRDFAKKPKPSTKRRSNSRRSPSKPERRLPGWIWLLSGTVIGAFAMFLVYLSGLAPSPSDNTSERVVKPIAETTKNSADTPAKETVPKPRLEFYQLLKESEVEIPEPEVSENENREPSVPQQYILQAGSFQKVVDADRMRAQLILLNLDAAIEEVTLDNQQIWHRVVVGPYENRSQMASARATLVSNNISPLVLKRSRP